MKSADPAEAGNGLWEEKVRALWEFTSATESLLACLASREFNRLAPLLEGRQSLIRSIDEIDERIGRRGAAAPEEDLAFHNLAILLREASALDAQCLRQAELLRDEAQQELTTLRDGLKASRRYTRSLALPPRLMDLRR